MNLNIRMNVLGEILGSLRDFGSCRQLRQCDHRSRSDELSAVQGWCTRISIHGTTHIGSQLACPHCSALRTATCRFPPTGYEQPDQGHNLDASNQRCRNTFHLLHRSDRPHHTPRASRQYSSISRCLEQVVGCTGSNGLGIWPAFRPACRGCGNKWQTVGFDRLHVPLWGYAAGREQRMGVPSASRNACVDDAAIIHVSHHRRRGSGGHCAWIGCAFLLKPVRASSIRPH